MARKASRREPAQLIYSTLEYKKTIVLVSHSPSVTESRDSSLPEGALGLCKISATTLQTWFVGSKKYSSEYSSACRKSHKRNQGFTVLAFPSGEGGGEADG